MTAAVLHLVNHCERGGNVHLSVDLACEQAKGGHRVIYASAGGRYTALLERCGVRHVRLEQNLRSPWRAACSASALAALCRDSRPDVLHAHMMSGAVLGRVAASAFGLPLVTTVHNSFDRHSWLMRLGDTAVAVSHAERDLLLARGWPASKVEVVVNGTIGSARSADSRPGAVRLPRPCVTTMCGLERRKGVHDVIEAFCRVAPAATDWHLVIAGDGPERTALERRVAGTGCATRIRFLGHAEEPRHILAQTDVFVLASYAEPFGLGILEAREAGCAVIGTRVGGIAEQLGPDIFGRTVPPGRPDRLAHELRRLMIDRTSLDRARHDARQELSRYSVRRMADEYMAIYAAAILARHARSPVVRAPATGS